MTEQELKGYIYIKARIDKLEGRIGYLAMEICEIEDEIGPCSVRLDGMPHGTTPGDPVATMAIAAAALHNELKELKAELEERRADLTRKEREIRAYIESVEDDEVKLIIEWRFIDLLEWQEIAGNLEELTGRNVDRSTPGKKMRNYLQEH